MATAPTMPHPRTTGRTCDGVGKPLIYYRLGFSSLYPHCFSILSLNDLSSAGGPLPRN